MRDLPGVTYTGPEIDDPSALDDLPAALRRRLEETNGVVAYDGGLHVRGACTAPAWHSLRAAREGELAFHVLYPGVREDDVPFAEDAVGDQWLMRGEQVAELSAETGEVEELGIDLDTFFERVAADPKEALGLAPLVQLREEGGELRPEQLVNVYPPYAFSQSADGVHVRAIDALEQRSFLADLARQMADVKPGESVRIRTVG